MIYANLSAHHTIYFTKKEKFHVHLFLVTDKKETAISTVVVRGATDNLMDDIERAVDDGVNTFKALCKVSQLCNLKTKLQQLWDQ